MSACHNDIHIRLHNQNPKCVPKLGAKKFTAVCSIHAGSIGTQSIWNAVRVPLRNSRERMNQRPFDDTIFCNILLWKKYIPTPKWSNQQLSANNAIFVPSPSWASPRHHVLNQGQLFVQRLRTTPVTPGVSYLRVFLNEKRHQSPPGWHTYEYF